MLPDDETLKYLSLSAFHIPPLFHTDLTAFLPLFEQCGTVQHFAKKDVLLPLDQQTETVHILKSGIVLESSSNANGLEKGVLYFPSYPIAFFAAIHQQPTVYTVTAFTDLCVVSLCYEQYLQLMQENRALLEASLRFIGFDSRNANAAILQNCSCSTVEKIYQAIYAYHLGCQHYPPLREVKLTQNLLATLSGVHRTSVAHVIKDLKEQEIISLEKKELQVLEPHILKDMAFSNLL